MRTEVNRRARLSGKSVISAASAPPIEQRGSLSPLLVTMEEVEELHSTRDRYACGRDAYLPFHSGLFPSVYGRAGVCPLEADVDILGFLKKFLERSLKSPTSL